MLGLVAMLSMRIFAQSDTIVMTVGDIPVSRSEFIYAYRKNVGALPLKDFVHRFASVKQKVCQAHAEGFDTTALYRQAYAECKARVETYASQTCQPGMKQPQEASERMAHVCIRVPQHISGTQFVRWQEQLDSIANVACQNGGLECWVNENKGKLPAAWTAEIVDIQADQLPNDLLDRLRKLEVGEMSDVFSSAVGLHLIQRLECCADEEQETQTPVLSEVEKKYLLREYADGLLSGMIEEHSFQIDEHELEKYYKKHKRRYRWKLPHFKGIVLQANDQQRLDRLVKYLKGFPAEKWTEAIDQFDSIGGSQWLKIEIGIWQIGKNPLVDKLHFKQGEFTPSADYHYVRVLGKTLKKKPESYKDVRADVEQDYRAYLVSLEEEKRQKKYKVEINEEVLKTVNNHDAI